MQYDYSMYCLVIFHMYAHMFASFVQITVNKEEHFCPSSGRVRTKLANYHLVAEKAIPFLKKDPNMASMKLQ